MQDTAANNKRIAKNTLFLYIRMGISMIISLYTSRAILQILGVVDMGVYNVVGGITSIFSWLSGSLSNCTQRFLNFEIGIGSEQKINNIFNQNFWIFSIFALISIIIIEIGGTWLIYNKLIIPNDRLDGAIWTLHATSFTLAVTLIGSVYDSVLIARENMKIYAYIGMIDVILKLLIVYLLLLFPYDKLKVYAVLLSCIFITSKLITIIYCRRKYFECRLKFYWNNVLFKEMLSFVGWNSAGTVVFILNNQGIDILLNMFFGPVVNAAKAISNQIRNVILNFTSNLLTAVRPQIVKNYASGDFENFLSLIFRSSRYLFFISWILGISIIIRIDQLLRIWLEVVPDYTNQFTVWIVIFLMINVLCDPLSTAFQAIGKQSKFIIYGSSIYLLAFPLSYFTLKLGMPPTSTFMILAVVRFLYLIVISNILKDYIVFHYKEYIFNVLWPIFKVLALSSILILPLNALFPENFVGTIITIISTGILASLTVFAVGLNPNEKSYVINYLRTKLHINLI